MITARDREAAILLVKYPDRLFHPRPEDLFALFDFLTDDFPTRAIRSAHKDAKRNPITRPARRL